MAELGPSWTAVSLSDSSAVTLVGDWSIDAQSGFHNASYPETPTSVAFTFVGTQARAVGFVTFDASPLYISPTSVWASKRNIAYDDPDSGGSTSETPPLAFYTTSVLPCNQHTLNFTISPDQAMQIKEFDFVPCTPADDEASALSSSSSSSSRSVSVSTTASASASSHNSVTASEKKQTLGPAVIVGAFLGTLAVLLALSSLAFFIFLHRRRHRCRPGSLPSRSSRPWRVRLPGPQPKPSIPPAPFLASVPSSSSPGDGVGGRSGQGRSMTMLDASGSASASAVPISAPATVGLSAPMLPWVSVQSAAYYPRGQQQYAGGGETAVEKRPLRPDDANLLEPDAAGLSFACGYLPDSKELMAWQEREQAGAQGYASPRTIEALPPPYQSRGSSRWSSKSFTPTPFR